VALNTHLYLWMWVRKTSILFVSRHLILTLQEESDLPGVLSQCAVSTKRRARAALFVLVMQQGAIVSMAHCLAAPHG